MALLAFSDLFAYLCYGSTAIVNVLIISVRLRDGPRAERVIIVPSFATLAQHYLNLALTTLLCWAKIHNLSLIYYVNKK